MQRTARMDQIEAMLADEPKDTFLRYALALEYRSAGETSLAAEKLRELLADEAYVPAYLMAGQLWIALGDLELAAETLRTGMGAAKSQGNEHAWGEMSGLLATVD